MMPEEFEVKPEVDGWSTFWDDETSCWMLAEHVYGMCMMCLGEGEIKMNAADPWSMCLCHECDGRGEVVIDILWDSAMSIDDYKARERQRDYLIARYGSWKVSNITDYWVPKTRPVHEG